MNTKTSVAVGSLQEGRDAFKKIGKTEIMENLEDIEISKIKPNPQNPRLTIREDVIAGIIAGLDSGFHISHALQVYPQNGDFVVLSGHHRLEAAKRKGIEKLPCWIRDDLDDDAAFMLLVTENNQGELSPLEIGIHALNYVEKSAGGRGKTGGLSEYADATGKTKQYISQIVHAAKVAKVSSQLDGLGDKTQHLSAIHSLPESVWPDAVEYMLKNNLSAKDTQERVKESRSGSTEKRSIALFCNKTSKRELDRIDSIKSDVFKRLEYEDLKKIWMDFFDAEDPVDIKTVQNKRIDLENIEYERKSENEQKSLPNLILADPPWRYDFSETDARQIENQYPSQTVDEIIAQSPNTQADCVCFLWATVAKLKEAFEVLEGWGFKYKTQAIWDKKKIGMGYWFRGQHEILLVGTKGNVSPPEPENRVSSIFSESRGNHSEKPTCVYEWIEKAFPSHKKLEMYARKQRPLWSVFGNEA